MVRPDLKATKATQETRETMDRRDLEVLLAPQDRTDHQGHKGHKGHKDHKDLQDLKENRTNPQMMGLEEDPDSRKKSEHPTFLNSMDPRRPSSPGLLRETTGTVTAKPSDGANPWDEYPHSTLKA
jgi:hypothetical protein